MEMLYGLIAAMSGQSNRLDHGGDLSNGLSVSAPLDRYNLHGNRLRLSAPGHQELDAGVQCVGDVGLSDL